MGILEQRRTGRRFTLAASTLVGRSSNCTLVLDDAEVSSQHAALFFGERGWAVRDLGSRNGTALQGAAVLAGKRLVVEAGAEIAFAGDVWVLADAGPPVATAVAPDGRRHHAVDELLALPDPLDPVVTIFAAKDRWIAETDEGPRFVTDGEALAIAGGMWTLELPPQTRGGGTLTTAAVEARPRSLATLRLMRVAVSRDEETIEVAFRFGDGDLAMPQRAHHALLRVLAQARLNDAGAPPAERGWMYADDLCRATGINAERLYVEVYRARKQLAALGVGDAAGLFERRSQSRQIRLGVSRIEVTALR